MKLLTLSEDEMDRITELAQVMDGQVSQVSAAKRLGLSSRHFRRLQRAFEKDGKAGIQSKRRGQRSNNRIPDELRLRAIELIKKFYSDFKPTLAHEKLAAGHGIQMSVETLRKLMIEAGIWRSKRKRRPKVYQQRLRRPCYGELIQMDGSPHRWLENRGPRGCLLALIDDATGRIQYLRFVSAESTASYLDSLEAYIHLHGRPVAVYTDKHSVFRVNKKGDGYSGSGMTQFGRALKELGIDLICANSPQAKGRVERLFSTLQDRLVKELRLAKISSIEAANDFLPSFIEAFNNKFAVTPEVAGDSHRALLKSHNLEQIICVKETRKLTKNLELSFAGDLYQLVTERPTYAMRGAAIEVRQRSGGAPKFFYKGTELDCRPLITRDGHGRIEGRKETLLPTPSPRGGGRCRAVA